MAEEVVDIYEGGADWSIESLAAGGLGGCALPEAIAILAFTQYLKVNV